MGARGSFSEEAGEYYIQQNSLENAEIEPLISAEKVLTALDDESIAIGILPIENSNGGVVLETIYAMAAHVFHIEKVFEIDIHHNLLAKPGTKPADVQKITSHDQALRQCRQYIKRMWPEADIAEYSDTAQAAHDLAEGVLEEHTAVIAPLRSAKMYGLEVLEESIQDLKFNYTSFLAVTKTKR